MPKSSGFGGNTAKKTANKTATPSPRNGNVLPVGAHPGNTGGKPGRSGRPQKAFKNFLAGLQRDPDVQEQFEEALKNRDDKNWAAAWGILTKFGPPDEGQAPIMTPERALQLISERLRAAVQRRGAAAE